MPRTPYTTPLSKSLEHFRDRIADYNDERSDGSAIFIRYAPGWCSYTYDVGLLHADSGYTIGEVGYHLGRAQRCNCAECLAAIDKSPESVLAYLRSASALTEFEQKEAFDWAADPALELAESEDGIDEREAKGESLYEYIRTDLIYRLGEQLPQMADDTIGRPDKERMAALRTVAAAQRVVARLEKLKREETK
jgi:hypothetical protein